MFLTIFTPSFNRKHLLLRLYKSLCCQRFHDFEWLVVDDGSTDGTDMLISEFISEKKINISFISKENGGKHTAYNTALKYAQGDYFFTVDSDDWLPSNAIQQLKKIIDINQETIDSDKLAGIVALKSYKNGDVIGKPFSKANYSTSLSELENSGNRGERSMIFKTSTAKKFLFPVIAGEKFMPECVVYDRIDQSHLFFVVNENLTICEYQPEGLSSNPKRLMYNNPGGFFLYFLQRLNYSQNLKVAFKYAIQANCFKYLYKGLLSLELVHRHKLLFKMSRPLGWLATFHYRHLAK